MVTQMQRVVVMGVGRLRWRARAPIVAVAAVAQTTTRHDGVGCRQCRQRHKAMTCTVLEHALRLPQTLSLPLVAQIPPLPLLLLLVLLGLLLLLLVVVLLLLRAAVVEVVVVGAAVREAASWLPRASRRRTTTRRLLLLLLHEWRWVLEQ